MASLSTKIELFLGREVDFITEVVVEDIGKNVVQITEDKYKQLTEGFTNQTDEQFNQLLLFVFTGILYLYMLDMMYQLGKKSY